MLKSKCKFLLLLALVITLVSTFSFATEVTTNADGAMPITEGTTGGETTNIDDILEDDNWVIGDLYIAGDDAEVDKIVDGNAFIIGTDVTITGEIGGDAFVCADKLTIDGAYIYSNLFVIANEVIINGTVYDIYAIADTFTLKDNGVIARDLRVTANTININGKVNRNVFATASKYNFNSENGALIAGNLEYSGPEEITIPEKVVAGKVTYNTETFVEEDVSSIVFSYIIDALNNLVFAFVVILLSIWLAPNFTKRITSMSTKKACVCLGIGFVTPIATIIALTLLLISSVCSMVALAGTFVFIAICMSGTAFASIYFGSLVAKAFKWDDKVKFVLATLIAALAIWAISQIPFIGGLFGFLVALFGIGILVVNVVYRKEEVKEEIATEVEKVEEIENTEEHKENEE